MFGSLWKYYFKNYKIMILLPIAILIFSSFIIYSNYRKTGDFVPMDISIKGGTTISVQTSKVFTVNELQQWFDSEFNVLDVTVRDLKGLVGEAVIGYEFQTTSMLDSSNIKEKFASKFEIDRNSDKLSIGLQGPVLGENFVASTVKILIIAYFLMGFTVFWYFRNLIPSISIVFSVFSDLIGILAALSILGMPLNIAGIGAILMMLGYSTDDDVLLTSNILKYKEGELEERMKNAFKTELTMNTSAFVCYSIMFLISNVDTIRNIALILMLGLLFDFINTWFLGAALQRLYAEKK